MLAEQERDGGVSPHTSPLAGIADVGNVLTATQFTLPTIDSEVIRIYFPDAFSLMRHLQGMGEGNCITRRRQGMSLRNHVVLVVLESNFISCVFKIGLSFVIGLFEIDFLFPKQKLLQQEQPFMMYSTEKTWN